MFTITGMKLFIVFIAVSSLAFARNKPIQLTEYSDVALGVKGWKVEHLPKATAHKFGPYPWCELLPYLTQDLSGKVRIAMRVTAIVSQPTPDSEPLATLPDAITLRADKETLTLQNPRRYTSFGAVRADFVVEDGKFIEKIADSQEAWLVAYTTAGDKERNDMRVPDDWKRALLLLLEKRKELLPLQSDK